MSTILSKFNLFQLVTFSIMIANRGAFFFLTWLSIPKGPLFISYVIGLYWWVYTISMPFAGALVDTSSKYKVSLLGSIVTLIAIAMLYLGHDNYSELVILFISLILSVGAMIFTVSSISYSAYLVGKKKDLVRSFKIRSIVMSLTLFVGPGLGGVFLSFVGERLMLVLLLIFSVLAILMYIKLPVDYKANETKPLSFIGWYEDTKRGFTAVRKVPTELNIALFMMLINFFITPYLNIAMPLLVVKLYHFTSYELGFLLALFGAGVIFGSFVITLIRFNNSMNFRLCLSGVIILGCSLVLSAFVSSRYTLYFLVFIAGLGVAQFNVIVTSSRASAIPDRYRSRIEAFVLFISQISIPLGSSLCGLLITWLGARYSVLIFGVVIIFASFLFYKIPNIKGLLGQDIVEDKEMPYYELKYPDAFKNE
ncbi:MFS transporter [Xenorhabdus budapestensis]|uniref:MFS transporter n=1 Tax=Xenorhabdus budapestensis TaxID=290110 RepID=A0ABX7VI22_XENBU|nr:MFS transporter [Xenorhabdus budapestensis]QTL40391.1 MFS transporter [Xenorhabdus budapestensis]